MSDDPNYRAFVEEGLIDPNAPEPVAFEWRESNGQSLLFCFGSYVGCVEPDPFSDAEDFMWQRVGSKMAYSVGSEDAAKCALMDSYTLHLASERGRG